LARLVYAEGAASRTTFAQNAPEHVSHDFPTLVIWHRLEIASRHFGDISEHKFPFPAGVQKPFISDLTYSEHSELTSYLSTKLLCFDFPDSDIAAQQIVYCLQPHPRNFP